MAYQSTPDDIRRAWLLGIYYLILAVILGYVLFVIWPPVPWPIPDDEHPLSPALARELEACGCVQPTASPSPSPTATPTVTPGVGTSPGSQPSPLPTAPGGGRPAGPARSQPATSTTGAQTGAASSGSASQPGNQETNPASTSTGTQAASTTPTPVRTKIGTDLPFSVPLRFFGRSVCTTFDERLILLVMIAGILGAFVHGATSLADFIGNNNFNRNWTWFYLLRPVIGMTLALVFYFVIRGGFLTTSGGAKDINPYGIAALAGLVGMFSKQATDKLSEVFSTLFKSGVGQGDDKRSGALDGENGESEDDERIDGCDVDVKEETADEDLPETQGGVES